MGERTHRRTARTPSHIVEVSTLVARFVVSHQDHTNESSSRAFQDRVIVIVVLGNDDLEAVAAGGNLVQVLRGSGTNVYAWTFQDP